MKHRYHVLFLSASLVIACIFVVLTSFRNPTTIEAALFQLLILISGLLGSYIFGKNAARAAAIDVIKPHARAAFRRLTHLYNSLYRLSERIEELKEEKPDHRLDLIQALIHEQIGTGQDAIEDWRDIVPEEVEQIEGRNAGHDKSF